METRRHRRQSRMRRSSRPCRSSGRLEASCRASWMPECNAELRQCELALLREEQLLCLFDRDESKAKTVAGFELGDERKIDARDFAESRIAARGLVVCHEHDRLTAWRQLDCPERDALRQKLDRLA